MFGALEISTSALVAQRVNLDTIAGNVAGMHTTRDAEGNPVPFRRRVALMASGNPAAGPSAPGVHVTAVVPDPSPFRLVHDPGHPDAMKTGPDAGYVRMPNVDYSTEMVNAMEAARVYEANVTVIETSKRLSAATLRLLA
ncbi:MAG: flagellar basal body rod protein FlgC [bacterium]|nr:flagellar basal body rod protein FlgC [bacterium]